MKTATWSSLVVLGIGLALCVSPGACLGSRSLLSLGSQCQSDSHCRNPLTCAYGRCREQCRFDRDCTSGTLCVPLAPDSDSYVCTLAEELSCGTNQCPQGLECVGNQYCRVPCDVDAPADSCGTGHQCVAGACYTGCSLQEHCTADHRCIDGYCAPDHTGGDADGGLPDGGEAGPGDARSIDGDQDSSPTEGVEWVPIVGGAFQMGSATGNANELPVHEVTVPSFELTRTEVTVAQYRECLTAGACTNPSTFSPDCYWDTTGHEDSPINCVDWNQAVAYCQWVGGRLPTEAEWEYASRSRGQDLTYPWGNEPATCDYAVMTESTAGCGTDLPWAVCSKPAGNTQQGLCDMAGNAWEWTQDLWHSSYVGAPTDGSAWEDVGSWRLVRGGGFVNPAPSLRATARGVYFSPTYENRFLGLRCARSAPPGPEQK